MLTLYTFKYVKLVYFCGYFLKLDCVNVIQIMLRLSDFGYQPLYIIYIYIYLFNLKPDPSSN